MKNLLKPKVASSDINAYMVMKLLNKGKEEFCYNQKAIMKIGKELSDEI